MNSRAKKYIARLILLAVILGSSIVPASGQSTQGGQAGQDEKTDLERQLLDIENQIRAYERELTEIKGQKDSLQNKIKALKKQQSALNLQIRATTVRISEIGSRIAVTEDSIERNAAKMSELKKQLAELIALAYEQDNTPLLHIVLSHDNLSDVLSELEYYSQVSEGLGTLLDAAKQTNEKLTAAKTALGEQHDEANNLLSIQSLQKEQLVGTETEQKTILEQTRGLESEYQAVLGDSKKKAGEIRNRLYQLLGVNTQITFGEAVEIAKYASGMTGVRAAFLLAILTQESNLGKNVGTCNRPGDPPEKSWRVVMKPERDQEPFKLITADLGMDPDTTPVSCPMRRNGKQIGWGGAMGPAQFIPSTWMGYKDKVAAITGKTANPWDIRDAFIASAIKLHAGGAGTVGGEWAAAMRYFSGGTNTKYRFYGDNVVKMANQYQADIEALNQ
ncbi:MAG: hypothetical protein A2751_03510 [Candidatus Doudnabacteria bacterium RIFCSPHIGHO2_01_FULL_46_14]|uniref:Transglycosylase SLT domain-containing protein n=1 Tax=Candidatus Doudnabacteria bacterium RIFCSPHIGHO2_01_FULL_46_14 TaxID=1817824 RepID=A0A1F5NKG9_9BACT|nr:MAG: hypothetical protein A2751_03510 [Candidatus Doudnabacteria bacterium RIFCSPHIGHO2_01_FULL_46_14]